MIMRKPNWVEYVKKGSDKDAIDYMDASILDTLDNLKKLYQTIDPEQSKEPVENTTDFGSGSSKSEQQSQV